MIDDHPHVIAKLMQLIIDHLDENERGRVNVAEAIRICAVMAASFVNSLEGDDKAKAAQHTIREVVTALALSGVALQGNLSVVAVAPPSSAGDPP